MRIYTNKELHAMSKAFAMFMRCMNGVPVPDDEATELTAAATEAGISPDILFNIENYTTAGLVGGSPSATEYVDMLANFAFDARPMITEESFAFSLNDQEIYSEVYHTFFTECGGPASNWNKQQIGIDLITAISTFSLETLMDEKLISDAAAQGARNIAMFLMMVLDHENYGLQPNTEKTEKETERAATAEAERLYEASMEGFEEDDSFYTEPDLTADFCYPGIETSIVNHSAPRSFKRGQITNALFNLSPSEISLLAANIQDVNTIQTLIDKLTDNKLKTEHESPELSEIHAQINAELIPAFVGFVRSEGIAMDDETANKIDVLCCDWDLRDPAIRKVQKLKLLIYTHAIDDDDMLEAVNELEDFYLGRHKPNEPKNEEHS